MGKATITTILAGDVLLAIFCIIVCNWVGSDVSHVSIDSPTDKIIWMLVVSVVVTVIALRMLLRESKGSTREDRGSAEQTSFN